MKTLKFTKEEGVWFINLKWWPGPKWCLAMVHGADQLLDNLSNNSDSVTLEVFTKIPKNSNYIFACDECLTRIQILSLTNGAIYFASITNVESFAGMQKLWLCFVTLFVYGRYPKRLFIRVKK